MGGTGWDRGHGHACSARQPPDNSRPCSAPVDSHPAQRAEEAVRDLERLWTKVVGQPYAGEPHGRLEVAGVGNVATVAW
jgi:hypothetical protein